MKLLKQLETLHQAGTSVGQSDGQLLDRFLEGSDESAQAAFAALVQRHGGMVLRVCRQVLGDEHDAQDASQAAFLVLARKARSIGRRESVSSWLYGVALRVAQRARLAAARRQKREHRGGQLMAARRDAQENGDGAGDGERWARLYAELGRLPESFRAPLVLCYLQGLSQEQAAAQLHCPLGTVQSRLARGKAKLKNRLETRGADISGLLLTSALPGEHLLRAPESWAEATVRLALDFVRAKGPAGAGAGLVSATLAEEVLRGFVMIKLRLGLAAVLLAGMLVSGAAIWAGQGGGKPGSAKVPSAAVAKQADDPKKPQEKPKEPSIVDRTVRGTVRDEQGRPVAKVWVGDAVQVRKGKWIVRPLRGFGAADRTDRDGRFSVRVLFSALTRAEELVFSSGDFSLQAIHVVRKDDPEKPLDVTLHPAREVRTRVMEPPETSNKERLSCDLLTVDPAQASLYDIPAISTKGAFWGGPLLDEDTEGTAPGRARKLDIRLPAGKYMLLFRSDTVYDAAEIVVPQGHGALDLPDISVSTLPWVRMLGKQPAEIETVDLAGKPVKLADFRGELVVLTFWSSKWPAAGRPFKWLDRVLSRFKDKPLSVLAIHDASITSPTSLEHVVEPIRKELACAPRIHWLLDRVPHGKGRNPPVPAGELGSGRTADVYGGPPILCVIDQTGKLVWVAADELTGINTYVVDMQGRLAINPCENGLDLLAIYRWVGSALESELEARLGRLRSAPRQESHKLPSAIKGKVVDLKGRPVPGATVECGTKNKRTVATGPTGEFSISPATVEDGSCRLTVWADALVPRSFSLLVRDEEPEALDPKEIRVRPDGTISQPLQLGPGVTVKGQLLREGKPVAGVEVGLQYASELSEFGIQSADEKLACKTDEHGGFRFDQVWTRYDCLVFVELGALKDQATVIPQRLHTQEDGSTLDVGVLNIQKGRRLAGRLVCLDGKALPQGVELTAETPGVPGTLHTKTGSMQRFEFGGIPDGPVRLSLLNWAAYEAIGYHLSLKNACLDPEAPYQLEGRVDRDVADLTILLDPDDLLRKRLPFDEVDPTTLADFNDAKAGPITGVPPADYPQK